MTRRAEDLQQMLLSEMYIENFQKLEKYFEIVDSSEYLELSLTLLITSNITLYYSKHNSHLYSLSLYDV